MAQCFGDSLKLLWRSQVVSSFLFIMKKMRRSLSKNILLRDFGQQSVAFNGYSLCPILVTHLQFLLVLFLHPIQTVYHQTGYQCVKAPWDFTNQS